MDNLHNNGKNTGYELNVHETTSNEITKKKKLNILHTMYINFIYVGPHSLYIYRPKSRTEMASAIFQSEKTINKSLVELDDSLLVLLFLPKLV
jgi:hypothetical protein